MSPPVSFRDSGSPSPVRHDQSLARYIGVTASLGSSRLVCEKDVITDLQHSLEVRPSDDKSAVDLAEVA